MEKAKVHFDITNVYVAKHIVNNGILTFDTPKRLYGAISMDLRANGETVKLRADGMDYYVSNSNNGYEGDLSIAMAPDWFRQEILGEELTESDKVLVENANSEQAAFALLYEFKYDKHHRRHVLFNCVASRPGIKGENKDNQRDADTESTSITASPMEDGKVKASTTEETPKEVYNNWFNKVWEKDSGASVL